MKLIIEIDEDVRIAIEQMGLLRIPDEMQKKVDKAIQHGIPIEQEPKEWIPVSERLPEDNTKVIVSRGATYKEEVIITWYQDEEHGFLCGQVVAWMPIPKPYMEG